MTFLHPCDRLGLACQFSNRHLQYDQLPAFFNLVSGKTGLLNDKKGQPMLPFFRFIP